MKHITDYLEKTQVDAMLTAARSCSQRDYLMIRVLWRSGIRINELLNLRPQDIEYHNHVINVVKAKGGKQRRVPLDVITLAELRDYVHKHGVEDDAPLFPFSQQWARELVKRYGRYINKHVHPHTFRHSYAINMVRHGVDIRRLQQVLGHASMNTTAVYLQFNDKDLQDVYAQVPF
ncbi:MAG: tyrosine-type recombinase/integrase [Halobacteriota archaeon]